MADKPKKTALARMSYKKQQKQLAKCVAASKGKGKKCSIKKTQRLKRNLKKLDLTGKTGVRRTVDKGVKVADKVANSKTGKIVGGAIKLAKNIKNLNYKEIPKTISSTVKNVKKAKSVINYKKILKKKKK
ncbi:MAG: hypothetical protein CMJ25_01520 [Phycisphaerae bacterium]|nr:hypothetical protein [Phycisphaerae bacterium]|tara:strand:+ start:978 stop:1367 length:390 start_codon:yes stop_codon:yes gene_type:complete